MYKKGRKGCFDKYKKDIKKTNGIVDIGFSLC